MRFHLSIILVRDQGNVYRFLAFSIVKQELRDFAMERACQSEVPVSSLLTILFEVYKVVLWRCVTTILECYLQSDTPQLFQKPPDEANLDPAQACSEADATKSCWQAI